MPPQQIKPQSPQWLIATVAALLSILITVGTYFVTLGGNLMTRPEIETRMNELQRSIVRIDRRLSRIEGRLSRTERLYDRRQQANAER